MDGPQDLAACGFEQRQQAVREGAWRSLEQQLEQRVSFLEALLRRRGGLDAPPADAAPALSFAEAFEGPFVRRGEAPEHGLYLLKEAPKAPKAAKAREAARPLARLLAGDLSSGRQLGL